MSWFTSALSNTLGRKIIVALTGLFLVIFLVVHLIGNLQLLYTDAGESFNIYAEFMTTNTVVRVMSFVLYSAFLIHIIWSVLLTWYNKRARPVGYAKKDSLARSWASSNMGLMGTIIFIFLVIHLKNFWYEMHWGGIQTAKYDQGELKDLYGVTVTVFSQWWYVVLYVLAMIGLAFHLFHGFRSMFQTLGVYHPKYNPLINFLGTAYAIIIPAAFAAIPLIIYFQHN